MRLVFPGARGVCWVWSSPHGRVRAGGASSAPSAGVRGIAVLEPGIQAGRARVALQAADHGGRCL